MPPYGTLCSQHTLEGAAPHGYCRFYTSGNYSVTPSHSQTTKGPLWASPVFLQVLFGLVECCLLSAGEGQRLLFRGEDLQMLIYDLEAPGISQ